MARRNMDSGGGGDSWLNTYADMVTLLLTFFVMLISMSSVDQQKFQQVIEAFQAQITDETPANTSAAGGSGSGNAQTSQETVTGDITDPSQIQNMDQLYQYFQSYVEQNHQENVVSIDKNQNVVYIRFNSSAFFLPNQYTLRQDSYPVLEFVGKGLKGCEGIVRMVNITGHTADAPAPGNVSDWRLSGDRAATVAIYLEEEVGFDPKKMKIEGYGKQYPIADNSTEEGRTQNRRVELVVIGNDQMGIDPDDYAALQGLFDESLYPTTGGAQDLMQPTTQTQQPEQTDDSTNAQG